MNIVPLKSETIATLREKRVKIIQDMVEDQGGVFLVLGGSFAGEDRQVGAASYAIITIFFELWERYTFNSWSYTFDDGGLMFYIRMSEDAEALMNTMIHYEDYHPLGFAIQSYVYDENGEVSRKSLGQPDRLDFYYKKAVLDLLNEVKLDPKYRDAYVNKVEEQIIKTDKQTVLSNIATYGYVCAFTKKYGFGMYAPNHRGSNPRMNFERFIYFLRTYKQESKRILSVNPTNIKDIENFQLQVENKIQLAVLNDNPYYYPIYMTSLVLFGFINSSGYTDISPQIKKLADAFYPTVQETDEADRYDISRTGMKEVFAYYVPYLQKNRSIISTLLYIMSRYDDVSVLLHSGKQNLHKIQFLAKNLIHKEDKWEELDQFSVSNGIYPHDATVLLTISCMLDVIQKNYIKIKILLDSNG